MVRKAKALPTDGQIDGRTHPLIASLEMGLFTLTSTRERTEERTEVTRRGRTPARADASQEAVLQRAGEREDDDEKESGLGCLQ